MASEMESAAVKRFAIIASILLFVGGVSFAEKDVRLLGDVESDRVSLFWEVNTWPSDMVGFILLEFRDDEWQQVVSDPIMPGLFFERDWAALGVIGETRETVFSYIDSATDGGLTMSTPENVLEILQTRGRLGSGDRLAMKRNFTVALASGFGLIHRSLENRRSSQYALFVVREGGVVDKKPVDTFSVDAFYDSLEYAVQDFSIKSSGEKFVLRWKLNREVYDKLGIFGYQIYRRVIGGQGGWVQLTEVPFWGEPYGDGYVFEFVDSPGLDAEAFEYAVEPVTVFQRKLERRKLAVERPPVYLPPTNLSLERGARYLYRLEWTMPEDAPFPEDSLFRIERATFTGSEVRKLGLEMMPEDTDYESTAIISDSSARSWVDPLRTSEPITVFYRVVLVDVETGVSVHSAALHKSLSSNMPPPPVENLTAQLLPAENETGATVRVEWNRLAEEDELTEYFRIASDRNSDELIEHSSYEIKNDFFELKVGDVEKVCTFRVVAVGFDGLISDPREVHLYVPKLRLDPFPTGSKVTYEPQLNELVSTISWEYGDRTDLRGFRIRHLKSDEIIADIDEIGPEDSEWVWRGKELLQAKRIPISIEAVGIFDYVESLPKVAYLDNAPLHYGVNYSLPQAEIESLEVYEVDDGRILEIQWQPWPEDLFAEVDRLGIGPAEEGKYSPIPLYRIGWHEYRVSENGRLAVELPDDLVGEVQMRLIPMYADDQGRPIIPGVFTEFTVDLEDGSDDTEKEREVPENPQYALEWETMLIQETAGLSDEFAVGVFPFENVSDRPIEITAVRSSCGCTTTHLEKKFYLPGDTGEIVATFEFEGRTGRQTKVIDVYVDGHGEPARLVLRTMIPKVLSIKPAFQSWEKGSDPVTKYSELEVHVEEPVKIVGVSSTLSGWETDLETIQEGKQYRLALTPASTDSKTRGIVKIVTDYPENDPKSFQIQVRVK